MNWHENKRLLLGVCGGIAAYKSPALVRELVRRGCEVRVVMTRAAAEFVTPLTLQALSGRPVRRELLGPEAEAAEGGVAAGDSAGDGVGSAVDGGDGDAAVDGDGADAAADGMGHIELARWAEVILIAPASADCIARLAHGRADDLLAAVVLAAGEDVAVALAPAMNRRMWAHPATRDNLAALAGRGARIIGPADGDQACGETGPGRMVEPADIAGALFGRAPPVLLAGAEVVVTAGPTWEALDPVRGLTNRSSGKMGYALARAARDFGARVTLVSGPVKLPTPAGVRRVDVVSAAEMFEAAVAAAAEADLFIGVAAVADYRPAQVAAQKIAKREARMALELTRNADILATVAALAGGPVTLGFAAETHDVIARARAKLHAKNADAIAANRVGDGDGDAIGGDENAVTLLFHERHRRADVELPRADKYRLAVQLIEQVAPQVVGGGQKAEDRRPGDGDVAGDGDTTRA